MGWAFSAVLELKIDDLEINEYISTQSGVRKLFEDSLMELRTSKISWPDTISNSVFFEDFSFYSQFFGEMKYKDTFDYLLGEYCFRRPDSILEILIYVAYVSTKITDSKFSLGIGDAGIFWMDAEFQNGRLLTIKLDDLSDDEIDEFKGNCFLCSESEIVQFFNPSIQWRIFQNGNSKEILNGLSDFINAMEEYATLIYETAEFDDFYYQFSVELEKRIYYIFSENSELKCDKGFILDLLEVLNLEKYFTNGDKGKWFNWRYEDILQYIYDSFSDKDLDMDKEFIQKIISYDPNYWFGINPKILDTEFVFRALNMELSYEKYETTPEEIIFSLLEKSEVLKSDKKFLLKVALLESTGYFEAHSMADLIEEFDISKEFYNDKTFILDLIKISPWNLYLLNKMESGASGIEYDEDADWDWYYSRLSEDLQSDEKFLNELKEILNE